MWHLKNTTRSPALCTQVHHGGSEGPPRVKLSEHQNAGSDTRIQFFLAQWVHSAT